MAINFMDAILYHVVPSVAATLITVPLYRLKVTQQAGSSIPETMKTIWSKHSEQSGLGLKDLWNGAVSKSVVEGPATLTTFSVSQTVQQRLGAIPSVPDDAPDTVAKVAHSLAPVVGAGAVQVGLMIVLYPVSNTSLLNATSVSDSYWTSFDRLVRNHALLTGLQEALIGIFVYRSVCMLSLDLVKTPAVAHLLGGIASYPFEVLRTKAVVTRGTADEDGGNKLSKVSSIPTSASAIIEEQGISGLWAGLPAAIVAIAAHGFIKTAIEHTLRQQLS